MDHTGDDELKRLRALNERLRTQRSTERERADRGDDRIAELELMVRDLQGVVPKGMDAARDAVRRELGYVPADEVPQLPMHPVACAKCGGPTEVKATAEAMAEVTVTCMLCSVAR